MTGQDLPMGRPTHGRIEVNEHKLLGDNWLSKHMDMIDMSTPLSSRGLREQIVEYVLQNCSECCELGRNTGLFTVWH